jgi:antiviral helicase SKI2
MASSLVEAIEKLHVSAKEDIDELLFTRRPRKHSRISDEDIKTQLEQEFLRPSNTFDGQWLNKLQT